MRVKLSCSFVIRQGPYSLFQLQDLRAVAVAPDDRLLDEGALRSPLRPPLGLARVLGRSPRVLGALLEGLPPALVQAVELPQTGRLFGLQVPVLARRLLPQDWSEWLAFRALEAQKQRALLQLCRRLLQSPCLLASWPATVVSLYHGGLRRLLIERRGVVLPQVWMLFLFSLLYWLDLERLALVRPLPWPLRDAVKGALSEAHVVLIAFPALSLPLTASVCVVLVPVAVHAFILFQDGHLLNRQALRGLGRRLRRHGPVVQLRVLLLKRPSGFLYSL